MTNARKLGLYPFEQLKLDPNINFNNLFIRFINFKKFDNFLNFQTIKITRTPKALRLSKTTAMTTSGITSRPFISTLLIECFSDYYKTTTKLLPLRMLKEFYKIMKIIIQHFFYTTATSLQKQL